MEEGKGGKRLSETSLPHPLKVSVKIWEKSTEAREKDTLPGKGVGGWGAARAGGGGNC